MRSGLTATIVVALVLTATPTAASAAPSCAEGPQIVGNTYVGTPCDDTIRAPRSVTTVHGEGGNDTLFGQRGNDTLFGGAGNDRLYGGIGDDRLRGGIGEDHLSGGFGADNLAGEAGSDFARGDATIDVIGDGGSAGDMDTLSFATGATPGFINDGSLFDYTGFPPNDLEEPGRGRGVYVDLEDDGATDGNGFANNGAAPAGGGVDLDLDGESFERVIGTPFPDFLVGSSSAETIYGGGGADVILGEGGGDQLHGGAEGDSCTGPGATTDCETAADEVEPRDPSAIAVGLMTPVAAGPVALYLTGSDEDDAVAANYSSGTVTFSLGSGSDGQFDTDPGAGGGCAAPVSGKVTCAGVGTPDSIVLAGLAGDDSLAATDFPATTSVILLGGEDEDDLTGGPTEDALVDGPGNDLANAAGGDDAVPNNGGTDGLSAGPGEDLFVSDSICDGDELDGGGDRDNANWANFDFPVVIDMGAQEAGLVGDDGAPDCDGEPLSSLVGIEDIEGTSLDDTMIGDSGPNQLLGRPGNDSYFAAGGNDTILANSGDSDLAIECGSGWDTALIDIPTATYEDPAPSACEDVEERPKDSFRPPGTPPDPDPPSEPEAESPPVTIQARDRTPPRTRLLHRPSRVVIAGSRWRTVVFRFAANERGATFRCKLDRRPFRRCRSPHAYRLRPGRHVVRVFAVDRAGNRDRSPTLSRFAIRRVSAR